MKYHNLKPTLPDTLRALKSQATNKNTVPHGIKTVTPGEGLELFSADGSMIFWDWEAANEYDERISSAHAEVELAKSNLAQTRIDLDAAAQRITDARVEIEGAINQASEAKSLVEATNTTLAGVETRLTSTAGELSTLKGTVGDVSAAAAEADRKAAQAVSSATTAQEAAETAMTEYDGLRVKLDAALAAKPGLIADSSFELPEQWITSGGNIVADVNARTGTRVYAVPASTTSQWAYSATAVPVEKDHNYRFVAYVRPDSTLTRGLLYGRIAKPGAGGPVFVTATSAVSLPEATTAGTYSRVELSWTATETGTFHIGPQLFNNDSRVLVEDFQVTDSTAEASLQIAVEDARQKAEAAARDAMEALTAANQAQTSANGKTNVLYTITPYAGMGTAIGDTNFVMTTLGGGGTATRTRRWTGTSWEDIKLGHQVISSVDLGTATVGELDGIRIKANSVTADKVTIGIGQNLIPNANATTGTAPHIFYGGGTKTVPGSMFGTVFFSALSQGTWGDVGLIRSGALAPNGRNGDFLINSRSEYVFRMRTKRSWSTGKVRVKASVYDMSGKIVKNVFTPDTPLSTTWAPLEVRLSGADVAAGVSVALIIQTTRDGEYWFETLDFREVTDGALIVNGTITGDKVHAESVAAKIGQFVKVQAENVEVTETFATRVANAMTTNTKNLVVTESAVMQHSTLLGTTVIERLNVTGELIGRNAIFDGTVDVDQLNVTGDMAAEIGRFMDIEARRAIFTEGLTSAESTLLGTTVAEAINANTIASRIMTGGLLQTTASANRGVKINNSGIRAWDSSGRQTVNINGTSNYLTGEFSTAPSGQRVKISNSGSIAAIDLYASRSTDDHVGMWYDSPDANVLNSVGRVLAIAESSYTRDSPGLLMWPMRGTVGLQGRIATETDTMKFIGLSNSVGLKAGEWQQIDITYQSAFPTNNSNRMPFVSAQRLHGADIMVNVVKESATGITLMVVNKSTSGSSGALQIRAVIFNTNG